MNVFGPGIAEGCILHRNGSPLGDLLFHIRTGRSFEDNFMDVSGVEEKTGIITRGASCTGLWIWILIAAVLLNDGARERLKNIL